jgi:glycosyltransferase involved in cell wall biosynthesis
MIPAYNCYAYVEQTLKSVINQVQDFSDFQIEIIDDHSTDGDLGAIVEKYSHLNIGYFRQEKNVGSLRNFETCINRAKGHWIHILHGDDMVKEGFYQEIFELIRSYPKVGAVFTDYIYMNEKNEELYAYLPYIMNQEFYIIGLKESQKGSEYSPAIVVKRSVYEDLGSFFAVHYGEDWEMWVRIASKYDLPIPQNTLPYIDSIRIISQVVPFYQTMISKAS